MAKNIKSEHERIQELEEVIPELEMQIRKVMRNVDAISKAIPKAGEVLPAAFPPRSDIATGVTTIGLGLTPLLPLLPDFESGAYATGVKLFAVQVQSAAAKRKADRLTDFDAAAITPPGNSNARDIESKEDSVEDAKKDIDSALKDARAAGGMVFGAALAAKKFNAARNDIEAAQASFDEAEVVLDMAQDKLDQLEQNNTSVNRLNNAIRLNAAMAKLKEAAEKIKNDVVNLKSAAAAIT